MDFARSSSYLVTAGLARSLKGTFGVLMGSALAALAIVPASAGAVSFSGPTNFSTGIDSGPVRSPSASTAMETRTLRPRTTARRRQLAARQRGAGSGPWPASTSAAIRSRSRSGVQRRRDQDIMVADEGDDGVVVLGNGSGEFVRFLPHSQGRSGVGRGGGLRRRQPPRRRGRQRVLRPGHGAVRFRRRFLGVAGDPPERRLRSSLGRGRVFRQRRVPGLAVANQGSNNVWVLLGDGTPFAPATNYSVGGGPTSVAVGDFNDDGESDLVTTDLFSDNVWVLLGASDGTFGAPRASAPSSTQSRPRSGTSTTTRTGSCGRQRGRRQRLGADRRRRRVVRRRDRFRHRQWAEVDRAGDFDNNGLDDLVTANHDSDNLSVLLGRADHALHPGDRQREHRRPDLRHRDARRGLDPDRHDDLQRLRPRRHQLHGPGRLHRLRDVLGNGNSPTSTRPSHPRRSALPLDHLLLRRRRQRCGRRRLQRHRRAPRRSPRSPRRSRPRRPPSVTVGAPISDTATLAGADNPTGTTRSTPARRATQLHGRRRLHRHRDGLGQRRLHHHPSLHPRPRSGSTAGSPPTGRREQHGGSGACNDDDESSEVARATPTISAQATANATIGGRIIRRRDARRGVGRDRHDHLQRICPR